MSKTWCYIIVFRLHRMHEMQTIVTDVRGVCLSRGRSTRLHCSKVIRCKSLWPHVVVSSQLCALSNLSFRFVSSSDSCSNTVNCIQTLLIDSTNDAY